MSRAPDPLFDPLPLSDRLAVERTLLASERTLAAWWRTTIAALGGAVALVKLFGAFRPAWLIQAAASAAATSASTAVVSSTCVRSTRSTAASGTRSLSPSLHSSSCIPGTSSPDIDSTLRLSGSVTPSAWVTTLRCGCVLAWSTLIAPCEMSSCT